jgi:XTP/dITP diphosphohydrolase
LEYGVKFIQVECPYPEVRSDSLTEVAEEGVKFVHVRIKKPVVVEDSGFFIQALDDFPGPYSAYVFGKIGNYGILKLLDDTENRRACFRSTVAYSDGETINSFEGAVSGEISDEPKGQEGFGYDPIFIPKGSSKTFAEDSKYKEKVSHRRKSVEKFLKWFTKENP